MTDEVVRNNRVVLTDVELDALGAQSAEALLQAKIDYGKIDYGDSALNFPFSAGHLGAWPASPVLSFPACRIT